MKKATVPPAFETCILCHRQTEVPVTQPIDSRRNYVVGLGQLCDAYRRLVACDEAAEGGVSDRYVAALLDACRREP